MNYILAAIAVLFITSCEKPKPTELSKPPEPEPKEARPQTSNQVKPEPAPESKPITMAYITGEDVQLATVSREGIVAGQKLELDLKPIALHWMGEKLFILTHDDEDPPKFELIEYTNQKMRKLDLPEATAWAVPHDGDFSAHEEGGALFGDDQELWMRRCAGGYMGDMSGCTTFGYVRLLPELLEKQTEAPKKPRFGVRFVDAPAGYDVDVDFDYRTETGKLVCKKNDASPVVLDPQQLGMEPEMVLWLSQDPPIFVVNQYDQSGEGLFDYYMIFTPCESKPHAEESVAEYDFVYGPNGAWAAEGGIYLDNQRIGQVDFQEADIPRYSGPGFAFSFAED